MCPLTPEYHISQFRPEDVDLYRSMRLEALHLEPGMFGNSHAVESAFGPEQWLARLTNPFGACFGLYYGDDLIGITGISGEKDKPEEAYMTQSYIRKAHRGKHLSRMLYEARFNWARARGIKRLIIGHRASNITSKAANQRFGFRYIYSQSRQWPDGATEDMLYYELML